MRLTQRDKNQSHAEQTRHRDALSLISLSRIQRKRDGHVHRPTQRDKQDKEGILASSSSGSVGLALIPGASMRKCVRVRERVRVSVWERVHVSTCERQAGRERQNKRACNVSRPIPNPQIRSPLGALSASHMRSSMEQIQQAHNERQQAGRHTTR